MNLVIASEAKQSPAIHLAQPDSGRLPRRLLLPAMTRAIIPR